MKPEKKKRALIQNSQIGLKWSSTQR